MCDELTEKDNEIFARAGGQINRRDFSKLGTAATFAAMFPLTACGAENGDVSVSETEVNVKMAEGISDSYFVHPTKGKHPAILMWPDIKGLRPTFKAMGKRLAMAGYAVLVVNPFYRDAKAPVAGNSPDFSEPNTRKLLVGMFSKLTQSASMSDANDYIKFLDAQSAVDTTRKIGTAGYCMGGTLIMQTAAAVPERVRAAASFHGYGLVRDTEESPHLLIPQSKAHVLHAIAQNDDEQQPEAKTILAEAYQDANIPAEIEVYKDTLHGWCSLDSKVYNEAQAEKAWGRMLVLFEGALG